MVLLYLKGIRIQIKKDKHRYNVKVSVREGNLTRSC